MSEVIDMIRAGCDPADVQVRHIHEGDFEIGKRPAMERDCFEIDGASYLTVPLLGAKRGKR